MRIFLLSFLAACCVAAAAASTAWPPKKLPLYTHTHAGKQGDPVNAAIAADEATLRAAFAAAGWVEADRENLKNVTKETLDIELNRPYKKAPVSRLFLFKRIQDIAFEKADGSSPRKRHHVRLWKSAHLRNHRPVWLAAATFDQGIEPTKLSHRIRPDIDSERDFLVEELLRTGMVLSSGSLRGVGKVEKGLNGEKDPYHTDGVLRWVELGERQVQSGKLSVLVPVL